MEVRISEDVTFADQIPDFEKTFIQCIVYNFETLKELGDEAAVRAAGKIMTKGKDYVVSCWPSRFYYV